MRATTSPSSRAAVSVAPRIRPRLMPAGPVAGAAGAAAMVWARAWGRVGACGVARERVRPCTHTSYSVAGCSDSSRKVRDPRDRDGEDCVVLPSAARYVTCGGMEVGRRGRAD
ncbi:hypothetical protein E2C01_041418 [Portunus trituberculatus]|uniref:Uncharacterized protein n=1 Tax=Portunus trituberculatus TaxID=210409 RepID=A0A5B7FQD5_PORTR|nr:hypothetical protein [Portunus trituberculatus]